MADKCPYCYRPIGTHTHDPILISTGAKYDWISDTELVYEPDIDNRWYKGFYQINEDDVIELQDELKTLEIDNDITPLTEFSPLNSSGKFQITGKHIKEMRDSVEKLLDAFGLTKTDYFNYDEDLNHIIHPSGDKTEWTDPITEATDLQKFQVKYIHIEDLRHYIQTLWQEKFIITPESTYFNDIQTLLTNYDSEANTSFVGDKGTWNVNKWVHIGLSLSTVSDMAAIAESLASAEGSKLFLFSQNNITGHNASGGVQMASYLTPITKKVNSTTLLKFDSTVVVSDSNNNNVYVTCIVTFAPGFDIIYIYGSYPSLVGSFNLISLSQSEFQSFNRNLYNDFNTIFGFTPPEDNLNKIYFLARSTLFASGFQIPATSTLLSHITVDNIILTN